ncbi:glycosyltransferase [Methanosphaera sp. WGK6]|uniref:glycosyltransferase n=1 Tax=Methanosphaera sp. WGK6 TaxID=1561964 RepID=UPI00084BEBA5|nr:glycosyltransferase [Methanosphaera sp. WGK6]OED30842.1 hypothetical protein NL43_00580 [Methanosphaera sp. WGK6]
MNILQVIPYFTFSRGGDVNVCYNLSKQLCAKGHTVTILTTTFEYNEEDTASISNLTMVPIEYKFNLDLFIYSPQIKAWLDKNIKNFDIIHLHELRSYQNNVIIDYAKKYNIPYIVQPHASTPKHVNKSFIKNMYDIVYGNKIMQNASTVIAVSEEEAYYDKKMNAKNVQVIYNGMNLEEYHDLPEKGIFQKKIKSKYLLYLGRLDKLKGINHIIEAFSELPSKYNEYKLVIAGKITDYKQELDQIIETRNIQNKILFTDFVKEEDKISIYHDAELFINPVKYMGGVSLTVFEAILSNTPVIVTPESGELIEKINAGTIVEYGNITQIKEAIINTLEDKETTLKQLQNGQKYIYTHLQWNHVTDKIIEIYKKIIEGEI